jgi:hypothetical protein
MVTMRTSAHVWFHLVVLVAALGACAEEDPEQVGTLDGAVRPGPAFDGGALAGGGTTSGGGTTGGFPGAPGGTSAGSGGGATTGGAPTGGTTGGGGTTGFVGGGTTGFFGGTFGGGFPGGRLDGGRPDAGSTTVDAGPPPVPSGDAGPDQFAELRQVCVDTINMHRATLGLTPLARANATQENCSDLGAQKDGMSRAAHSSAGGNTTDACKRAGLGAQNTCPGWPSRPTLADSLKRCLQQMWDEGEPPGGTQACIADRTGCFQMYGHWINMTSTTSRVVSCGFYDMGGGTFWMNQDFGR